MEVAVCFKECPQAIYYQTMLANDPSGVFGADLDGNGSDKGSNFQLVRLR